MRILPIASAFALLAATAQAAPFNGPYVGLQGGYDTYHADGSGTFSGVTIEQVDLGAEGGSFGIFAGYGHTFGALYLGAELAGSLNTAEMRFTDSGGDDLGIKSKSTYGADIRAGFLPSPSTLLYGSLGAVRTNFDGEAQLTGSETLNGLRVGLGAETMLTSNITARLGWTYTDYQTYSYDDGVLSAKLSPSENLFRAGLAFNF